jgi:predicted nuclease with TOPRIM domain
MNIKEVTLEDLVDEIISLAERLDSLETRVESIELRMDNISEDLDRLTEYNLSGFETLNGRFDLFDEQFDRLETRIASSY